MRTTIEEEEEELLLYHWRRTRNLERIVKQNRENRVENAFSKEERENEEEK